MDYFNYKEEEENRNERAAAFTEMLREEGRNNG